MRTGVLTLSEICCLCHLCCVAHGLVAREAQTFSTRIYDGWHYLRGIIKIPREHQEVNQPLPVKTSGTLGEKRCGQGEVSLTS